MINEPPEENHKRVIKRGDKKQESKIKKTKETTENNSDIVSLFL